MGFVEWQHLSSIDNDPKMSKKKRDKGAPAVAIKIFRRKGEYSEGKGHGAPAQQLQLNIQRHEKVELEDVK